MGTPEHKRLVRDYFDRVSKGDPTALDALADDVTWWVPPGSDMAGLYEGKQAVLGLFGKGMTLYSQTDPMKVTVDELIAEADTVCAQVVIEAKTAKGKEYRNHYHFVFKIRDGKIRAVKEYVDTQYAHEVLFG
jgi:uncharacterized protein